MEFDDDGRNFLGNRIFTYNHKRKIAFAVMVALGAIILFALLVMYLGFWKDSSFLPIRALNAFTGSVVDNMADSTLLGVFYNGAIGGLFFVILPTEIFLGKELSAGHPLMLVLVIYLIGTLISYFINYYIGLNLSGLSKKLVSPKQFYSIKGKINKYGGLAIFAFNALPLPSQPLSVILGVFRYNKTRFSVYLVLGQIAKVVLIELGVSNLF